MAFDDTFPLTPFEDLLNALVGALNERLQIGTNSVNIAVAGTPVLKVVNFPIAFPLAPKVLISSNGGVRLQDREVELESGSETTTGFTVYGVNTLNTTAVTFTWVAILP